MIDTKPILEKWLPGGPFVDNRVKHSGSVGSYRDKRQDRTYMSYMFSTEWLALTIIWECMNEIKKCRKKGMSDLTTRMRVTKIINQELYKNADFSKYAENNISKQDIALIIDLIQNASREDIIQIEDDYNKRHKIVTRNKAETYTDDEVELMHQAAAMVVKESADEGDSVREVFREYATERVIS